MKHFLQLFTLKQRLLDKLCGMVLEDQVAHFLNIGSHLQFYMVFQAQWKQNCIGPAYRYLYLSAYVSQCVCRSQVGVGACPPPGKCFRLFWGPKHHYYSLLLSWHGNKILIHLTFACMEVSIHQRFQSPGEFNRVKEQRMQAGQNFALYLVLSYSEQRRPRMCGHHAQNLFVLRSLQLSGPFGPAVAGSAGPALPPLSFYKYMYSFPIRLGSAHSSLHGLLQANIIVPIKSILYSRQCHSVNCTSSY